MWIIVSIFVIGIICVCAFMLGRKHGEEQAEAEISMQNNERQEAVNETASHDLSKAKRGDVLIFEGASEDFEDINLTVDRINRYESARTGYSWNEYTGMSGGKRVSIEYHDDDEPYITLDLNEELDLEEAGLDEEWLAKCDEEQSTSNSFEYDGKQFKYVESGETFFYKDGKNPEGYWSWDFKCVDDERLNLYVQKWEDEPFEVGLSKDLTPHTVKLFPV